MTGPVEWPTVPASLLDPEDVIVAYLATAPLRRSAPQLSAGTANTSSAAPTPGADPFEDAQAS